MLKVEVDELHGVVAIRMDGPLAGENFRVVSDRVEPEIHRAGGLRGLILQAEQFPGWRDLSDFLANMRFLREGVGTLGRVAAVTDSAPVDFLRPLVEHFESAEVQHFRLPTLPRAERWAAQLDEPAAPEGAGEEQVEIPPVEADDLEPTGVVVLDDSEAAGGDDIDDWFVKS